MTSMALLLLGLTCSPAQFAPPTSDVQAAIRTRPNNEDVLPRGGLFVATVQNDALDAFQVTTATYGDDGERLEVFPSCTVTGEHCIYRSRFPFDGPDAREILLEASASSSNVTDLSVLVVVGEPDRTPPRGLGTVSITVTQEEPTLFDSTWSTTLIVDAGDVVDDESDVALLEFYETTENDLALLAHAVTEPDWSAEQRKLYVTIDVPETTTRCYQLVATDLGGNEAATDDLCFELVIDDGWGRACSQGGAPPALGGLLLLMGLLRRRRR